MKHLVVLVSLVLLVACSKGGSSASDGGVHPDSGLGPIDCTRDVNMDGIPDQFEAPVMPGVIGGSVDDDADGFSNEVEAVGDYPGYVIGEGSLACGHGPLDCDDDGIFNIEDTDSDNDGLIDADERTMHTNPCNPDTDGDMTSDLVEVAAGTDPLDPTSHVPDTDFDVVLPYLGPHVPKTLRFSTNLQKADIYFLIDTTGSMQPAIDNVRSSLTEIAMRVAMIPDVQMGVGRLEDFPFSDSNAFGSTFFGAATDVPYEDRQDITPDVSAVSAALGALDIGDGHDGPEAQVEALYQTATGEGGDWTTKLPSGGLLDGLSAWSLPPKICGTVPDEDGMRRGYPCFRPESLPIVVLVTDIEWHNGYADGTHWPYSAIDPSPHTLPDAAAALHAIGGRYIGIAVGDTPPPAVESYWRMDHEAVAMMTGSVDASGAPLVYDALTGEVGDSIMTGLETLVLHTPEDVSTRTENVAGNPGGVDATGFIKSIVPLEGYDASGTAGLGYVSKDATTFYGVTPGTDVVFTVDFYNDFVMPPPTAQVYRARIVVLGNGVARLSERQVYIVVPPDNAVVLM